VRAASRSLFALYDHVILTFDLILIVGRGLVVNYPCAKFCEFNFSRFGFMVRTNRHTLNALLPRLVVVSKYENHS